MAHVQYHHHCLQQQQQQQDGDEGGEQQQALVRDMMDVLKMRQSQSAATVDSTTTSTTSTKENGYKSKRHGSLQPQANDEQDEDEDDRSGDHHHTEDRATSRLRVCIHEDADDDGPCSAGSPPRPSLLPALEAICSLSRDIWSLRVHANDDTGHQQQQDQQDDEDDEDTAASLASLYCDRALALLQHAQWDASVTLSLDLLQSLDPEIDSYDVEDSWCLSSTGDAIASVSQALHDATTAVELDPHLVEAYHVAAECARCLGKPSDAAAFADQALRLSPQSKELHDLMRQLRVDLDQPSVSLSVAPPMLCRSTLNESNGTDARGQDDPLSVDLTTRFYAMELLTTSPLLHSLEAMMHESLHHQCASGDQVKALNVAFQETVELLCVVLNDSDTTSCAILVESCWLEKIASQLRTSATALVENTAIRKWIVKTLTPAVVQSIPDEALETVVMGNCSVVVTSAQSCRAALLRDVLLVLTRLLLARGNLQRCTKQAHAMASIKMACDLTKQLSGEAAAPESSSSSSLSSSWMRLEMVCTDAYAVALLDLTEESGEALLLHQESLELAIHEQDRHRELRCHHLIGRALFQLHEHVAARDEFTVLLQQSQALGDSAMECLAQYHLGELCVAAGDGWHVALRHFEQALRICHATANCHGTWRAQSIQRAMDFYASMATPTRRRPLATSNGKRKSTLLVAPRVTRDEDWDDWTDVGEGDDDKDDDTQQQQQETKQRRAAAVWMSSSSLCGQLPETPRAAHRSAASLVGKLVRGVVGAIDGVAPPPQVDQDQAQDLHDQQKDCVSGPGPLTTHNVSLMSWLIGGAPATITRTHPACWKPRE